MGPAMAEAEPPYEYIDHTADLGVRGRGETLGEAFANAARGLFGYVIESDDVRATGAVELEMEAETADELLLDWLQELLYIQQVDLVAYADFEAEVTPGDGDEPWRISSTVHGEDYDRDRHGHIHEVKAVTYHAIQVQEDPPLVEVIVDI